MILPPLSTFLPFLNATVSVAVMGSGTASVPASAFFDPVLPDYNRLVLPSYAFFIEHESHVDGVTRRVLFDLGLRSDVKNYPPTVQALFDDGTAILAPTKDVATQLEDGGIKLDSVEAIIYSHTHFDHTGSAAMFPNSTAAVFGPGTKAKWFPGYPTNPNSALLESDFAGRETIEISFNESQKIIGEFRAHDYFGDGSLYLLDVPGHMTGHISALARTSKDSWIYLGGDTCHHAGQIRPSPRLLKQFPCPGSIVRSNPLSPEWFGGKGPGSNSSDMRTRTEPLFRVQKNQPTFAEDPVVAQKSVDTMAANFDARPDVWVLVAHDSSLVVGGKGSKKGLLELFPKTVNDWRKRDLKEKTLWSFLERGNPAFRTQPTGE